MWNQKMLTGCRLWCWVVQVQREGVQREMVVGGVEGEILACLGNNVLVLTHAGYSIASTASPWREREKSY